MNQHSRFNDLETELAAMRPQPPSPGLQQRIASRLRVSAGGNNNADVRETFRLHRSPAFWSALAASLVIATGLFLKIGRAHV